MKRLTTILFSVLLCLAVVADAGLSTLIDSSEVEIELAEKKGAEEKELEEDRINEEEEVVLFFNKANEKVWQLT